MSPKAGSSASASSSSARNAQAPYTRRPAGQPKSSRQQFSACGACRMRRVRCDLKDLPFTASSPHPACSNCKERGLKCVDEFADVKAVKLLRRGRRLQQVEALYGKVGPDGASSSSAAARLPSIIPQLKVEFFSSPFWHWFCIQRPVLDPAEFSARYFAHVKGVHSLGNEGGLLAMVLVVWAASFGVDERGVPEADDSPADSPDTDLDESSSRTVKKGTGYAASDKKAKDASAERKRKEKKEKTEAMLREVLELIDFHGVMRRPTWDGVRVLLLIMPLMEEAHPLERLAMYEAALSQTQALCTLASGSSEPSSSINATDDASIRARIFWYAHMHEGTSTGMRGGRLVLNNDDLDVFQNTLPPVYGSGVPSLHSPPSAHGSPDQVINHKSQRFSPAQAFVETTQLFMIPLQLSGVCRKVHVVLTGPKATRRAEEHCLIDAHGMREIWDDLDHCWHEFDSMRRSATTEQEITDTERFVSAWQIFIFESHNIIRESLKQCMSNVPSSDNPSHPVFSAGSPSRPSSHSSSSPYLSPHHLHAIATRKCLELLPCVLRIIKYHLSRAHATDIPGLFEWDAGLIRDGCFFAGYLAASVEGDTIDVSADDRDGDSMSTEEGVALCLTALAEMRWAFSKSEEREETVRMVWENRKSGRHNRFPLVHSAYPDQSLPPYGKLLAQQEPHNFASLSDIAGRTLPPPLSLLRSPRRPESAPNTAASIDGHGVNSWPTYTPPGTATSVTTSAGTGVSARGSPIFTNLVGPLSYKGDTHDSFYSASGDLDQFSFSAPMTGPGVNGSSTVGPAGYHHNHHRNPPATSVQGATSIYLDPGAFGAQSSTIIHASGDINNCPQFGEDCNNGYYH